MWQALIVAGIVLATFSGKAQANTCTVSDILALQKQGLTQQQIEAKCLATTALPTWLNGDWQVYRQEGNSPANRLAMGMLGISQDIWRIRVTGNTLSVAVLMNHHLGAPYIVERPQRVFDLHLDAQVVHFKVRGELGEVTQFSLQLTEEVQGCGCGWQPSCCAVLTSGPALFLRRRATPGARSHPLGVFQAAQDLWYSLQSTALPTFWPTLSAEVSMYGTPLC